MQVPESMLVTVDFEDKAIPEAIREFRPAVYRDGESFCVLLGEDPQAGIFGCGETRELALSDWLQHFNQRMSDHIPGDAIVQYVEDTRSIRKKDM